MNQSDFTYATAGELAASMASGTVSSVELTREAIARIEERDPDINAICIRDFDAALATARKADEDRAQGMHKPLLGIPMTIKESFNVSGLPTTWGIPPFKDFIAKEDAVAVDRLRKAGAVILGKTNVPLGLGDLQTYNTIYGTTNNPWNLDRTPGGSSGGSAAALAAGFGALSMGSDIAGSLRVPAHFCGIFSHKPTFALVPGRGHTPPPAPPLAYERDLAVVGPMGRCAMDLETMLSVLAGPDPATGRDVYRLSLPIARHRDLPDYRVLVLDSHPMIPTADSIRKVIDGLSDNLLKCGVTVYRQSDLLPDLIEEARVYMRLLTSSAMSAAYPAEIYDRLAAAVENLSPTDTSLWADRARGNVLSHRDWLIADAARTHIRQAWRDFFEEFDILVCPVTPTPAFSHDQGPDPWARSISIDGSSHSYADQLVWAGLASLSGLPATTVPIGFAPDGMPIGVQLIGAAYEDLTTIKFAALLEREFGGFTSPPRQPASQRLIRSSAYQAARA